MLTASSTNTPPTCRRTASIRLLVAVTFTDAAGKATVLRLGEDTPTGSDSYAMTDGDPRLYTISTSTKATFNKGLKDLREKHLLTFIPRS